MKYAFKYKRKFIWTTIRDVKGHQHQQEIDRMDIFLDDGILSICKWSKCDMRLGSDFILSQKAALELKAGQPIKLNSED